MITRRQIPKHSSAKKRADIQALLTLKFQNGKQLNTSGLFASRTSIRRAATDEFMGVPDYTLLVSRKYTKDIFSRFLGLVISVENIVPEETDPKNESSEIEEDFIGDSKSVIKLHGSFMSFSSDDRESKGGFSQYSETKITGDCTYNDKFIQTPKIESKGRSLLTYDLTDPDNLSEIQLQILIELKMSQLDLFNSRLENKAAYALIKKYQLTQKTIDSVKKLQIIVRRWILKRKFFKALRMNQYIDHKKNYIKLKKCVERFDTKHQGESHAFYYRSVVNVFNDPM